MARSLTDVSSSFAYGLHIQGCSFHPLPTWTGHRASPSISQDSGSFPFYPHYREGGHKQENNTDDEEQEVLINTRIS